MFAKKMVRFDARGKQAFTENLTGIWGSAWERGWGQGVRDL